MNMTVEIPGRITLKTGIGGLRFLELRCRGSEAHVYLHGAHVLHYQPAGHTPVLWHSQKSFFEANKPIRGGVPVCWPWFGAHPSDASRPAHGFARLREWEPVTSSAPAEEATSVTLQLPTSPDVQALATLTVILKETLTITLKTVNTGAEDLPLSEALHSYFAVSDVRNISLTGLDGQRYIDTVPAGHPVLTQSGPVTFTSETDRLYVDTQHACTIFDPGLKRRILICKENSHATVVWNPWIEKAARMVDFGDHEYPEMVCVETANCGPNTLRIPPGDTHTLTACIQAAAL